MKREKVCTMKRERVSVYYEERGREGERERVCVNARERESVYYEEREKCITKRERKCVL